MITLILLLASVSQEPVVIDQCDLLEINHHYTQEGRLVFTQYIFYEWDHYNHRHQVIAWRLKTHMKGVLKNRDWVNNTYRFKWNDKGTMREVRSSLFKETWTTFDPELLERDYFPKDRRKGLSDG